MFKNRLFDAVMAIAILAVVGFTIQFTAAPAQVVPSSAAIGGQMTGTYLPQAAMTTATGPQMTGTYLPQGGTATINGRQMTGTYLPQAAMQPNSY